MSTGESASETFGYTPPATFGRIALDQALPIQRAASSEPHGGIGDLSAALDVGDDALYEQALLRELQRAHSDLAQTTN